MEPISEHNRFYLAEDRRDRPKEYFKFLVEQTSTYLGSPGVRVLDVGCATGDFLHYVKAMYPKALLTGIDSSSEFIDQAQNRIPDASFHVGDIYSGANLPAGQFDIVFMSGVVYLFPELEPWLINVLSLTARRACIFSVFNPDDLDVHALVRRSADKRSSTPWNLFSHKSIGVFLDSLGVRHRFVDWEMPIPIPRTSEDPLRSWTIPTSDGHLLVVNGMQIVHRFAVLQIDVAD